MGTALLFGRDPIFAWALQKIMADLGLSLEHVYTLPEARTRLERFSYRVILLDGLRPEEINEFQRIRGPQDKVIVFNAVPSEGVEEGLPVLAKGMPMESMISSLRETLQ